MRSLVSLLAPIVAITIAISGSLGAQSPSKDSGAIVQRNLCFRGQPLPYCKHFWLLETELTGRLLGNFWPQPPDKPRAPRVIDGWYALDLGAMRNRDSSSAIGGTAQIGYDYDGNVRVAAKLRYRRWDRDQTSIDYEIGLLQLRHEAIEPFSYGTAYGVTAGGALNLYDRFALTSHADVAFRGSKPRASLLVGARVGSKTAIVSNIVAAVGGIALLFLLIGGGHGD